MTIFRLSDTETLIDRLLDILAGIWRKIRHCVLHDTSFYSMRSCEAVDKTRNMEHPGTFRNIPEHPGTSNNYDNYEKNA